MIGAGVGQGKLSLSGLQQKNIKSLHQLFTVPCILKLQRQTGKHVYNNQIS